MAHDSRRHDPKGRRMDSRELDELLGSVAAGRTGVAEAHEKIAMAPIRDIGYATLDTSRELRQGQG